MGGKGRTSLSAPIGLERSLKVAGLLRSSVGEE